MERVVAGGGERALEGRGPQTGRRGLGGQQRAARGGERVLVQAMHRGGARIWRDSRRSRSHHSRLPTDPEATTLRPITETLQQPCPTPPSRSGSSTRQADSSSEPPIQSASNTHKLTHSHPRQPEDLQRWTPAQPQLQRLSDPRWHLPRNPCHKLKTLSRTSFRLRYPVHRS